MKKDADGPSQTTVGSHAFFYTKNLDSWTSNEPNGNSESPAGTLVDNRVFLVRCGSGNTKKQMLTRSEVLQELEKMPDSALISTRLAGIYLEATPKTVRLLYQDKLVDGVQARGPSGRIKIRLGSLRRMTGEAKKVRK